MYKKYKTLRFPEGFLWGAATSAHQVEGNNHNDWTEWEKANAEKLAQEAKDKWQKWQQEKFPEMFDPQNYISGKACDHYNRYEEDFDIAKSLGHNAHRFSIEWSRIEPEEGKFNEEAIEHYRKVLLALRERGMEPFVTLWHWTNPLWIRDIGGWENKHTVQFFLRYVEKIIDTMGKEITFWIAVNEQNVYTGKSYIEGSHPPQIKNLWRASRVLKNLVEANNQAYSLIHQKLGNAVKVGSTHFLVGHLPFRPASFLDRLSVKLLNYLRNFKSFNQNVGHQDFIGVDFYHLEHVEFSLAGGRWYFFNTHVDKKKLTDKGWEISPKSIYDFLMLLKKYKLPVYILENGLADAEDSRREKFINDHLFWVVRAIRDGVDVRGYFHWSLLDNFEWDAGFWQRFGLVEVDYKTMERKIRPSAYKYAKICKSNSLGIG